MATPGPFEFIVEVFRWLTTLIVLGGALAYCHEIGIRIANGWEVPRPPDGGLPGVIEWGRGAKEYFGGPGPILVGTVVGPFLGLAAYFATAFILLLAAVVLILSGHSVQTEWVPAFSGAIGIIAAIHFQRRIDEWIRSSRVYRGW